jgi:uncharacterized membrane protein YraQ (UPF0718 family)
MQKNNLKKSFEKTLRSFSKHIPLVLGIILLISIIKSLIPRDFYASVFRGDLFLDSFIGSAAGSISFGTPITSYIIGGELLSQGVGLIAVTAFIVSWVTVGLVQLPAESIALGKKFALLRNLISFIFSIIIAIITVFLMEVSG